MIRVYGPLLACMMICLAIFLAIFLKSERDNEPQYGLPTAGRDTDGRYVCNYCPDTISFTNAGELLAHEIESRHVPFR